MHRWTLRITICMILGAISTVAVSWACALWSEAGTEVTRFEGNKGALYGFGYREKVHILDFRGRDLNDPREVVGSFQSRKRLAEDAWAYPEFVYSGWPFEAMYFEVDTSSLFEVVSDGVEYGGSATLFLKDFGGKDWRELPTVPVWPGFLFNTVVYTAIWFALSLGIDSIRRTRRRRKGLCPHCAYNLRNNLNSGCPECGWNRVYTTQDK